MTTVYLLLVILVLAPTYKARPQNINISQSGNTRISTVNGEKLKINFFFLPAILHNILTFIGVIKCDEMICPSLSVGCNIMTKTTDDLINVITVKKCYDSNGKLSR